MNTILLIEDNDEVRDNTTEILELANYRVFAAANGKEGVNMALKHLPDLIICDIMMPELDGFGVIHLLSKHDQTAKIPFIFLSAKNDRSDIRKGMELGADDYLTKPFDDIELLNAIEIRLKKINKLKAENAAIKSETVTVAPKITLVNEQREVVKLKKKQILFSKATNPHYLYFVLQGKIKTFKFNEDGKEFITNIYTNKSYLGYVSILEDKPYNVTAEAIEESEVMLIPKDEFLFAMQHDKEVCSEFVKLIAANLVSKENKLIELAYNSLRQRVAGALIMVSDRFYVLSGTKSEIIISREDLANLVGTATESLIRTLSDFKSEKLIEIVDGKIKIANHKKLKELAG